MKKEYILGILFFSGILGISEAFLGEALYSANIPFASVPLTIIGMIILTFAMVFLPKKGTAILIAAMAMLFKFLNIPFFACHLLGILMMGICFDLFFNVFRIKNRSLSAAAAVYSSYTLFALMITYVFQYEFWVQAGFTKVLSHIGISGSIAALGCAFLVPASFRLAEKIKANLAWPFNLRLQLAPSGIIAITIGLWIYSIGVFGF